MMAIDGRLLNRRITSVARALSTGDVEREAMFSGAGARIRAGQSELHVELESYRLQVSGPSLANLETLATSCAELLLDLLASDIRLSLGNDLTSHDFVWFAAAPSGGSALIAMLGGPLPAGRTLHVVETRIGDEKTDWLWRKMESERSPAFASLVYRGWLTDAAGVGLSQSCPILAEEDEEIPCCRGLVVRVDPELTWPLLVPFDHFVDYSRPPYGVFARYRYVDRIITDRMWSTVIRDRLRIDGALSDRDRFASQTRLIVNHDYDFWDAQDRSNVDEGVEVLRRIDRHLRPSALSAVAFNPTASETLRILADPSARYVLVNFHTHRNRWKTCRGETIPLGSLADGRQLKHLELVSASHCQSVADPTVVARHRSICQQLLDAGVTRTGGNMLFEYPEDYLCRVLLFLTDAKQLGPLTFESCVQAREDFDKLVDDVDAFLTKMGYGRVDREVMVR